MNLKNTTIVYRDELIGTLFDPPLFWLDNTFKDKMRGLKGECAHFSFKKCSIYTHDGATVQLPNLALTHTKRIAVQYTVIFGWCRT
jgi:hypothetical protein